MRSKENAAFRKMMDQLSKPGQKRALYTEDGERFCRVEIYKNIETRKPHIRQVVVAVRLKKYLMIESVFEYSETDKDGSDIASERAEKDAYDRLDEIAGKMFLLAADMGVELEDD
jgi:hypothetical protein